MTFYIYKLTNKLTSKIYIGKTSNSPEKRLQGHIRDAQSDNPTGLLQRAIKHYGIENFSLETLATTENDNEIDNLEKHFIKLYDCCILDGKHKGYNMTRGGEGFDSDTVRSNNFKRVANGTHPWAGTKGSILNSNLQKRLIAEGRHPWAGEIGSKLATKLSLKRVAEGTNPWAGQLGSEHSKRVAAKCLAEGRHHSQQTLTCPHCKKVGTGNSMYKWHFDKCQLITNIKVKQKPRKKVTCPYCGKEGSSNMTRYHFNNCKFKIGQEQN